MDLLKSPRLYAYTGGRPFDPAKPTVVFMHGAQHDHSVWILQSRYLAHHGYSVLALDLPGHMRSVGPPLASIEAIADRVAEGSTASGARRLMLVGQSMGSLIGLEVARRLPEHCAGVALVAVALPMRVSDALLAATRDDPPDRARHDQRLVAQPIRRGLRAQASQSRAWLLQCLAEPSLDGTNCEARRCRHPADRLRGLQWLPGWAGCGTRAALPRALRPRRMRHDDADAVCTGVDRLRRRMPPSCVFPAAGTR